MATKLTKRICEAAAARGTGWSTLWDSTLSGFGMRVRGTGRKTFVVFYRTRAGEKRLITLGRFPELSVDDARKQARLVLGDASQGGDPLAERKRLRRSPTVGQLSHQYLELHSKLHKRSWKDDAQRIKAYVVPPLGARKAESVRRADIAALLREVGTRGRYVANQTLALVSSIYNWGEREGLLPEGHANPCRGVQRFRVESRDRWLSAAEIRAILESVELEGNEFVRAYFWLALLTGCRKRELLCVKWSDVDLELGLLRLGVTKSGRVHYVPLAKHAQTILRRLPQATDAVHVFPGREKGQALSVPAIDQAWRRIRARANARDARLHDLRRTVGSWLAQSGASLHLIGHVLNHRSTATTAIYARFATDSARAVLERHADAVLIASVSGEISAPLALDGSGKRTAEGPMVAQTLPSCVGGS